MVSNAAEKQRSSAVSGMVNTGSGGNAAASSVEEVMPDQASLWMALSEDTSLPIMIVDSSGVVEFANAATFESLGAKPSSAGKKLSEFFDEDFATERLQHIQDAFAQNRPVTVDAMQKGRLTRTTIRPIAANGHPQRRALLVMRPAPAGDQAGNRGNVANGGVLRAKSDEAGPLSTLTPRETEILGHIGRGLSTAEIAKALGRSVKTVEWHRVSLGEKLGVTNRVELARIAIASGLVGLDSK
jgi:DNA-binding CsgD family transcriptional regulator